MERTIRWLTFGVVLAVATFAAVVSYSHVYDLARLHGQSGTAARLLPLSVDGLILAASLVLLHEARAGRSAPALARWMLWLGVAATLAANAAYGWRWGVLGIVTSTWPAASFIGSVELVMLLIRRTAEPASGQRLAKVATDLMGAAKLAYEASVIGGNPLSERLLASRFGISRPDAKKIIASVAGSANGHKHEMAAVSD